MEHLAILKKSWGLLQKILSGEKKIESRWYANKYAPWDKIKKGEIVYFKDSGDAVSVRAYVSDVLQFNLTPLKVKEIIDKYGDDICIPDFPKFTKMFKDKKYCILVFLKNPVAIEPFDIDKSGYGMMSAWITVDSIDKLRKV